ncbi:unnamed protein product [Rotaria magnacalcarata]|uniref:Complex 1 LYR protein domain-containing protein n=1 Tax=Rotaria magnacalcarata TaxID=392030 RepID=A0A816R0E7_9BILA|nr:unnamed protein product [Rotaria magnacalcarata]CAF1922461.1 unnamed protein product [Rotaria magnacalcarata]CAF2057668.1 unnamed protein product [Rotaria magnacalcarata]CAF2067527.1 unnamed protein product [Rotaria magnacalcarata]CAF3800868.1 unnamed protein product [Rotaria magnacalcarata]
MNSTKRATLTLYKQLFRECHKFSLYNYREYFVRRVREDFRKNRNLQDPTKIAEVLKYAQENLEVIKRQVIVGNLYTPKQRSIIENQSLSSR